MSRNPPPLTVNHITDAIAGSGIAVSQEGDNLYYFTLGDTQYALVSADHVKYGAAWSEEYHSNSIESAGNVSTVNVKPDDISKRFADAKRNPGNLLETCILGVTTVVIFGVVYGSYWWNLARK